MNRTRTSLFLVAMVTMLLAHGSASGFSGAGSGTEADPYVIATVEQLQEMRDDVNACYALGNNIDAGDTRTWGSGAGFEPIGGSGEPFTGIFDGKRRTITNLYINRPITDGVGLFGYIRDGATVQNVGLVDADVTARRNSGTLVGSSSGATVRNSWSTGMIQGSHDYQMRLGGLIGISSGADSFVHQCFSSVDVTATGGAHQVGGLAGYNGHGSIMTDCYATGNVSGTWKVGGLVGDNPYPEGGYIAKCYSTGRVTGTGGGLVGFNYNGGVTYDSYWDIETSGRTSSKGGAGKTTAQMMQQATFAGWDFVDIWGIIEDETYPFLASFETRELTGLEIVGPNELGENFHASYRAIAHCDNNSTADVTDLATWGVEPNTVADIDSGQLTAREIAQRTEDIIVYAQYTEGETTVDSSKPVTIFAVCPTGTALEFDGKNDYVLVGDHDIFDFGSNRDFSISAWIKTAGAADRMRVVDKIRAGHYPYEGYEFYLSPNGSVAISVLDGDHDRALAVSSTDCGNGDWHMISAVADRDGNLELYIDGRREASDSMTAIGNTNNNIGLAFGRSMDYNGQYFPGTIDEVAIYEGCLSAGEILTRMHGQLTGEEPNLIGCWDFDEGIGQIAYDLTANGSNGRLGSSYEPDSRDPVWVASDAPVGDCPLPCAVDIKPGGCPNPLNVKSRGVVPVAILGSQEFNVGEIDVATISLAGANPVRSSFEDVAAAATDANECECTQERPDGYTDLTLKFKTVELVEEIVNSPGNVNGGEVLVLPLTGSLYDGVTIEGRDCVKLVGKVPPAIAAKRSDINDDGVVNIHDFGMIAEYWLETAVLRY